MRLIERLRGRALQELWYSRSQRRFSVDLSFSAAAARFPTRNSLHAYFHHYFHHYCDETIRRHRRYYKLDGRGFGEDAFHAMWFALLREFRPVHCAEIGVYRGQVITMWTLCARLLGYTIEVHGISPFSNVGDTVSTYRSNIDYLADTLASFDALGLSHPTLVKALSTDRVAVEHLAARKWDLIYIDGSHDYEIVLEDYRNSVANLKDGGILVMDDASLDTEFHPPLFSFAGHPGPSRVACGFAMKELCFLGAVGHNNVFQKK